MGGVTPPKTGLIGELDLDGLMSGTVALNCDQGGLENRNNHWQTEAWLNINILQENECICRKIFMTLKRKNLVWT